MQMSDTSEPREILHGTRAIADVLGVSEDAAHHLIKRKRIPAFKLGRTVCARRSSLLAAMAKLEEQQTKVA
jgi:excisionase family DNA binding protein